MTQAGTAELTPSFSVSLNLVTSWLTPCPALPVGPLGHQKFGELGRENLPDDLPQRPCPAGLSGSGWYRQRASPLWSESSGQAVLGWPGAFPLSLDVT